MGVLSGQQIIRLVATHHLTIEPFEEDLVQPASYDLRLGSPLLASPLGTATLGTVIHLTADEPVYEVRPGQMVGVISEAKISMPLDISGRFGIVSGFARKGINAFGGLQLDPGWRGRLILSLLNVGPEPVPVRLRDILFSVEFSKLDEVAAKGYEGHHQDQDSFPADQVEYILSARTTSLAEIPALRQEIARLRVIIEELEELFGDPDEGLEITQEVRNKLLRSSKLPRHSLLSPDEMRRKLGL